MTVTTAIRLAHEWEILKIRRRTGGEGMHPDHYDFQQGLREGVMAAIDAAATAHGMAKLEDKHLSELFKGVDALAERLFLERYT